jgi:predicted NUDIX family NTP pyrophosphohydrolase
MPAHSAGILLYKLVDGELRVLLAHPGGPFWRGRDAGAWSIPKGEYAVGEDPRNAARREFREELGIDPPGELLPLGEILQKAGKRVTAFAVEGDFDITQLRSNTFEIEWPPRTGQRQSFPEVDQVAWFTPDEARRKILQAQMPLLTRLGELVADAGKIA